jgi:stress-induced morphogen
MDTEQVLLKFKTALSFLGESDISLKLEEHDVLRVKVVSDHFKGIRLTQRIDIISNAILDFSTTDLVDYGLIINPLTFNEVKLGIRETETAANPNNGDRGLVAHP